MRAVRQWRMTSFAKIDQSAHEGANGNNLLRPPTRAQADAGNYRKGRVTVNGMRIAIENPRGSLRKWRAKDGSSGANLMKFHYGYFEGSRGADGDGLDVFIGPWPESGTAFVINQVIDGKFDEHKVMLGFPDKRTAVAGYLSNYNLDWDGMGSVITCPIAQLKWWLAYGNKSKPLTQDQLPYEERKDMDKVIWDSAHQPVGSTLAQVLYQIRTHDGSDGLVFDRLTVSEILEDADGVLAMDALVIPFAKLEARMSILEKVMDRAGHEVKVTAMQMTEPFSQRGTTNVAVVFELSDGQTVSVFFHNPDTTPKKITADDDLISWKWMLNKKDVTIAVAPERGRDLNVRTVAARIMLLAEKNSARFGQANAKRTERMQTIEGLKQELSTKETELDSIENHIKELEIDLESKYAKTVAASNATQGAYLRAQDNGGADPETGKTADELRAQIDDEAGQAKALSAALNGEDKSAWRGGVPAFLTENSTMTLRDWDTGDEMPEYSGVAYDYMEKKFVLTELESGERTIIYLQAATHTEAIKEAADLKAKLAAPAETTTEPVAPSPEFAAYVDNLLPKASAEPEPPVDHDPDGLTDTKSEEERARIAQEEAAAAEAKAAEAAAVTAIGNAAKEASEAEAAEAQAVADPLTHEIWTLPTSVIEGMPEDQFQAIIASLTADNYHSEVLAMEAARAGNELWHREGLALVNDQLKAGYLTPEIKARAEALSNKIKGVTIPAAPAHSEQFENDSTFIEQAKADGKDAELEALADTVTAPDPFTSDEDIDLAATEGYEAGKTGTSTLPEWVAANNPQRDTDLAYFNDVIGEKVDMWDDGLADRLEAMIGSYAGDAEMEAKWKEAVTAYTNFMVKAMSQ